MPMTKPAIYPGWNFDNSYASLPDLFFKRTNPVPVVRPGLAVLNRPLAISLGLDVGALESEAGAAIFAGNTIPEGAEPLAQAYAGHQYGRFTMLGDGRAILLGEQITPSGARVDIQLKGSGRTPFSRRGDGRATLGPMLREYIISEAMHALGIPTTRCLAVATTGEAVAREEMLPGAVLTRVAASHIRVGTFEFIAASEDPAALRALADYTIRRHYPELAGEPLPYRAFLEAVIDRQAALVTKWLLVGFVHGVMNTDNMAVSGETIDYGPCAFLDAYDPDTAFSSIDQHGRYAHGHQATITQWNLARFAESLIPLLDPDGTKALDTAKEALATYAGKFRHHWMSGMRSKLGLFNAEPGDITLMEELLSAMQEEGADYTNTFRALGSGDPRMGSFFSSPLWTRWNGLWTSRLSRQEQPRQEAQALMRRHSPAFIPRNHKVEEALEAAVARGDLSLMGRLLNVLSRPYEDAVEFADYSIPPEGGGRGYQTFCGT
ncbi:MAG: protein adenylyltransferase SelO [Terrimicrobiaceae bacterium]